MSVTPAASQTRVLAGTEITPSSPGSAAPAPRDHTRHPVPPAKSISMWLATAGATAGAAVSAPISTGRKRASAEADGTESGSGAYAQHVHGPLGLIRLRGRSDF